MTLAQQAEATGIYFWLDMEDSSYVDRTLALYRKLRGKHEMVGLAMQAYLATAGADKVGFTVIGKDGNGQPIYRGGVRGAVERNAMRYYLAIDAYLASLQAPADQQPEKRIQAWFNATERYARQLHEMDRGTYVAMKRGEYARQQAAIR